MQGAIRWEALILVVSTALVVGLFVYKVCVILGELERRIQRLEIMLERRAIK